MLNLIREFFSPEETETQAPRPERIRVATCVILLEMAQVDDEFSAVERDHIVSTLQQRFSLSAAEAEELIAASIAARDDSFDLWHFTHELNNSMRRAEKERVMEEVWGVVYADGILDAHEDYLAHKLAKLLNLNHSQLIAAKLKAKERMAR